MPRTILVTGATGFIGRELCLELARRKYAVRAAVRESSRACGLPAEVAVVGDIAKDADWSSALEGVEVIIHLASRVHVMRETAPDPMAAFRGVNVGPTAQLAGAAAMRGVKRLIFVSSVGVNGKATTDKPFAPNDMANPHNPYAISKWEAEQVLWRIAKETRLEVTIVRAPLVYGPRVGGNFLRLLKLVERGLPLPLASVDNRRSMILNANLVGALIACAANVSAAGNTYLVSDGEDISTRQLIRELAGLMGRSARLWPFPPTLLRLGGRLTGKGELVQPLIDSLQVDSSRIRVELQWVPPFTVAQGLAETVQWFVNQRRHSTNAA